jgi:hypothetical protein
MARINTQVIFILCWALAGCGGDCIRHSDCPAKEVCIYGKCGDKGQEASNGSADGGEGPSDVGGEEPSDTGPASGDNGEGTDENDSQPLDNPPDESPDTIQSGVADTDADSDGDTTIGGTPETDSEAALQATDVEEDGGLDGGGTG